MLSHGRCITGSIPWEGLSKWQAPQTVEIRRASCPDAEPERFYRQRTVDWMDFRLDHDSQRLVRTAKDDPLSPMVARRAAFGDLDRKRRFERSQPVVDVVLEDRARDAQLLERGIGDLDVECRIPTNIVHSAHWSAAHWDIHRLSGRRRS